MSSFFEFHCHTTPYSKDAGAKLDDIIKRCERRNIRSIAITDHDEIEGALRLKSIAPPWLNVVLGEEINTSAGEIIGIFLKKKIPPGLSPEETLAEIKKQGGISVVPHPFDRFRSKVLKASEIKKNVHAIDIIETFNARNLLEADNKKAEEFAEIYEKPCICGGDAHFIGEYGRTVIANIDCSGPETFLRSLHRENFKLRKSSLTFHLLTKYMKIVSSFQK